eukprot:7253769-Prymnesium_polylepis.1
MRSEDVGFNLYVHNSLSASNDRTVRLGAVYCNAKAVNIVTRVRHRTRAPCDRHTETYRMTQALVSDELYGRFLSTSTKEQTRIKTKLESLINKQLSKARRPWHVWPAGNRVELAPEAIEAMRDPDRLFTKGEDGAHKLLCLDIVLRIRPLPAGKLDKSAAIV